MILKAEAIVLKTFDFRETSKIAVFFTRQHGKVKGVLKGIRADYKKFGSNIDKFSVNDIVFYHHRNSDLHLISQCDLKDFFFPIRQDIKRTTAAQYVVELIDAIMPVEQENKEVYNLLINFLNTLQDARDVNKLVHILQIKLLYLSGFRPHLDSCVVCDKKISGRVRFSSRLGGLMCTSCKANDTSSLAISQGTVASLIHIEKNNWAYSLRLGLAVSIKKELKYILNNFLVFHLEKRLKSEKYLNRL